MAARQTIKPAGYRLVKTCSLLFWPSTSSPPLSFALKKAPEAGLGAFVANKKTCGALVDCMLLSTSLWHVLMRKPSLRIPFRGMGGRLCRRIGYFAFCTGM